MTTLQEAGDLPEELVAEARRIARALLGFDAEQHAKVIARALMAERERAARIAPLPLMWVADHGVAGLGRYRLFQAATPLGKLSYGTDAEGIAYWHAQSGGVFTVANEATARRQAEAFWTKLALAEAAKFIVLNSEPKP